MSRTYRLFIYFFIPFFNVFYGYGDLPLSLSSLVSKLREIVSFLTRYIPPKWMITSSFSSPARNLIKKLCDSGSKHVILRSLARSCARFKINYSWAIEGSRIATPALHTALYIALGVWNVKLCILLSLSTHNEPCRIATRWVQMKNRVVCESAAQKSRESSSGCDRCSIPLQ